MKQLIKRSFTSFLRKFLQEDLLFKREISSNCKFSPKSKLYAPYEIRDSSIDDYTYISQNAVINRTFIGKFCSIGPNIMCGWGIHPINRKSTSPMFYSNKKQNGFSIVDKDLVTEQKDIHIGNDVFIGMNVTILDGVSIGDGAVIGAGAVVSKNIPPYAIAVGNPIKVIKYRFNQESIENLLHEQWWDKFDLLKCEELGLLTQHYDDKKLY